VNLSILYRAITVIILMFCTTLSYAAGTTILVLGDSLSAGYRLQQNESWVDLLAIRLRAANADIEVVNASVSGATSADGLNALPTLLNNYKPQIVIVALGSNDGLRNYPLIQLQNNLAQIIADAQASQAQVLLVGFQIPPNYNAAYQKGFIDTFVQLSDDYDIPLLPFLLTGIERNPNYFQKDRLHPNAAAQEIILQNVWQYLEPMLRAQGSL
jgi:acyl-CoA thioesterase-1